MKSGIEFAKTENRQARAKVLACQFGHPDQLVSQIEDSSLENYSILTELKEDCFEVKHQMGIGIDRPFADGNSQVPGERIIEI